MKNAQIVRAVIATALLAVSVLSPHRGAAQVPPTATLTFAPVADGYVDASSAKKNFNTDVALRASASPVRAIYLRFAVAGLNGRVVLGARLRLGLATAASNGGTVHRISDTTWSETKLTWANRPAVDGPGIAGLGAVAKGAVVEFDLGTTIGVDGTYSLVIDGSSNAGVAYNSAVAKSGQKPLLVLTVANGPEPTVRILQPAAGAGFFAGDPATLQGTAIDAVDGDLSAQLAWSSDVQGALGTGATVTPTLVEGAHVLSARVTDHDGFTGEAHVAVTVGPRPPADTAPLVAITAPLTGRTLVAGVPVAFSGTADDLEDGSLTSRLSWASDRDGALGTGGAFSKALSAGTHRITARVTDRGGLVGVAETTVMVEAPVVLEVTPVADAYVDSASASGNFGTKTFLSVDAKSVRISYLRFAVSGVGTRNVVRAVLRMQANPTSVAASPVGGTVHTITNGAWQERTVAYKNRPAIDGPTYGSVGAVRAGQVVDFDVTGGITGDGVYNLALTSTSIDNADYRSRETTTPPKLVLSLAGNAPVVAITSPANQAVFIQGAVVVLTASASDVEDGDLSAGVHWSSSLDGDLGDGASLSGAGLQVGTHVLTAAVSDHDGHPGQAQISVRVRAPNTPPTVTIVAPASGVSVGAGASLALQATVGDDFDTDLAAHVHWTSDQDGDLGTGGARTVTLHHEGTHVLSAAVTDSDGASGSASVTVLVTPTPPVATISAPAPGAILFTDVPIAFTGTALDATDGDLSAGLVWSSDVVGPIGSGTTFTASLPVGTHVITASATDAGGLSGSATRTVLVRPPDVPPALTIEAPADGSAVFAGRPLLLAAHAMDVENGDLGAAVHWSSSLDGALGTGAMLSVSTLSPGAHVLTATVSDHDGASAGASVSVVVAAPTLAFAPIADTYVDGANPALKFGTAAQLWADASPDKQVYLRFAVQGVFPPFTVQRARLRLTAGSASASASPSGGDLHAMTGGTWSEAATTYASRPTVDGPTLATQGAVAANQVVDFDVTSGVHADGTYDFALLTGSADEVVYQSREASSGRPQLILDLRGPNDPQVIITAPGNGGLISFGQAVAFAGSASDPQDGDLSAAIRWTSSIDGPLGTGASFSRTLGPGTHTIAATVSDSTHTPASATVTVTVTASGSVGFRDFTYPSAVGTAMSNEATAQKPESHLWFVDGTWWATLYSTAGGAHRIHRLDRLTQRWIDTGVFIDERPLSRQDCLWDGNKLYMSSRTGYLASGTNRLLRYSYDATLKTWFMDPGFPVTIPGGGTESLTLAKDSTGRFWLAYTWNNTVYVATSLQDDMHWSAPFVLPATQGLPVDPDDIAGVIAMDGKIGVFWTNQKNGGDYFAWHPDAAAPTASWTTEVAVIGNQAADDHFNMKFAADGRLWVVMKTSRTGSSDILVGLLVRATNGTWSPMYSVGTFGGTWGTRGLVQLDELHRRVYVFYSPFHQTIYYKSTDMDAIALQSGLGIPFITSTSVNDINNPTGTKQAVTPGSGIVVIASSPGDLSYWHNTLSILP